jgi:cell division protease FtsH
MNVSEQKGGSPVGQRRGWLWVLLVGIGVWAAAVLPSLFGAAPHELFYSDFKKALAGGELEELSVSPKQVLGRFKQAPKGWRSPEFASVRVDDPQLTSEVLGAGVKLKGVQPSSLASDVAAWLFPLVLGLLIMWPMLRGRGSPISPLAFGKSRARLSMESSTGVSFADVAGVDEAIEELKEVVEFLRTPERFERLGGRMPKGILLMGPPGTGKTLLARAVAGQARVPFFNISGSEFVELFVGVGAARVRDLFQQAKASAPCIIFIDELDALGKVRGGGAVVHEEREQTLNQLLVELDGFDPRVGVVLMAATNRPETLDPALLRAGRFDRHVLVDRPDRVGRLQILKVHARKVRLMDAVDLERVATLTPGLAGADLANIVNEAALLAVRRNHDAVERDDFDEAVERVVAGLAKHSRVLTAPERERVAYHEVGHALVALASPNGGPVQKVSIIPRGVHAVGYTMHADAEDRRVLGKVELEAKLAVLLGGRAAEAMVLGNVSTGAEDDIARATQLARAMVREYGMSDALGPVRLEPMPNALGVAPHEYGEEVARTIDREVQWLLEHQERRAQQLLEQRRGALEAAAKELLAKESLTGEELQAIVTRASAREAA